MSSQRAPSVAVAPRGQVPAPLVLGAWVELRSERCSGGRWHHLLVNRRDRVALTLTADQADTLSLRCGTLVCGATGHEFRDELTANGFPADCRAMDDSDSRPGRAASARSFLRTLDIGTHRAHGLVEAVYSHGARLAFTRVGMAAQAVLAVLGVVAFVHAVNSPARLQFTAHPAQVPLVLGLSLAAIAVHELAHALVVVHNGRRIDVVGFRLHLGTPAFYVEATDGMLLARRQRMVQAIAGSWAEWQVTALVALVLWATPSAAVSVILYRFVIFNTITIASNLLPFTGLDGHLFIADLMGEPDLDQTTRGALGRVATAIAAHRPTTRRDRLLAGYCMVNAMVATVLLACAGLFWYALFGGTIHNLLRAGPIGWATLAAVALLLCRPALHTYRDRVSATVVTTRQLLSRVRFRLEWRWRIPAVQALATLPELGHLDEHQLGILAGRAERLRLHRNPTTIPSYAYLHRGRAAIADTRHLAQPGDILIPGQRLLPNRSRVVLITFPPPITLGWPTH